MLTDDDGEFPAGREIFRPERPARPIWPVFLRYHKGLCGGSGQFPCAGTGIFSVACREFNGTNREIRENVRTLPRPASALFFT
jgi:hypothetical protein